MDVDIRMSFPYCRNPKEKYGCVLYALCMVVNNNLAHRRVKAAFWMDGISSGRDHPFDTRKRVTTWIPPSLHKNIDQTLREMS